MNQREWEIFIFGLIDGLEQQLNSSAPKTAKLQLAELRECANKANTAKARMVCERKVDGLCESTPMFREVAGRLVGKRMDSALDGLERAVEGMAKLVRLRGNKKGEEKIAKSLKNFREKRSKVIYGPIKIVSLPRRAKPQ